jgi:hypothetical protein
MRLRKRRNNEELYARNDVDAVLIATADFQHALHGVEAVRAGRDAYVEKPMANTMDDARAILKAVEETKRFVQIGSQRRSGSNYIRANEFIKSGKFGDIVMVEMTWNVNQPGRWRRPQLRKRNSQGRYRIGIRFLLNRRENGAKAAWDPRKYLEFRLVLALLVGHSLPVDVAPDRHRALVLGPASSAQRRSERRNLSMA